MCVSVTQKTHVWEQSSAIGGLTDRLTTEDVESLRKFHVRTPTTIIVLTMTISTQKNMLLNHNLL